MLHNDSFSNSPNFQHQQSSNTSPKSPHQSSFSPKNHQFSIHNEESDDEVKIIINNVLKKHNRKMQESRKVKNKIQQVNEGLEEENSSMLKEIKKLEKKLSKLHEPKLIQSVISEKSVELKALKKRLEKAEETNSKMESQLLLLSESQKRSKSKRVKFSAQKSPSVDYYSPIMDFNNYTIESRGVNSTGTQVTLDQEEHLQEDLELEKKRAALEKIIEENNKKINKFEKKMAQYI